MIQNNNQFLEPNQYLQNQKTYELNNDDINKFNNQVDISPLSNTNYQTKNINFNEEKQFFEPRTFTNKFKNLENSSNNNEEEMEEFEEDTEKEAVEFIQLQHKKIKNLKKQIKLKDEIINDYKVKIDKMNLKFKDEQENKKLCNNLRQQIEILAKEKEELKLELYSKDKLVKELKMDLNDLSQKFSKFNNNILNQSEEKNDKVNQLTQLLKEYSAQLKKNEEKLKIYENENIKLNQNLTNEMKSKQKLELLLEDKLEEDKNWISKINTDIQLLCEWMNNYIGTYFDSNYEIPNMPLFTSPINRESISTFNRFNFNLLRQTISELKTKISNKQAKYENIIEQDKKEQIELLNKIESQNKNIALLNNNIILLKEEIAKKNVEIEEMNNKVNSLIS